MSLHNVTRSRHRIIINKNKNLLRLTVSEIGSRSSWNFDIVETIKPNDRYKSACENTVNRHFSLSSYYSDCIYLVSNDCHFFTDGNAYRVYFSRYVIYCSECYYLYIKWPVHSERENLHQEKALMFYFIEAVSHTDLQ